VPVGSSDAHVQRQIGTAKHVHEMELTAPCTDVYMHTRVRAHASAGIHSLGSYIGIQACTATQAHTGTSILQWYLGTAMVHDGHQIVGTQAVDWHSLA
jgi:hypothetical protein